MKQYEFDKIVDRSGSGAIKVDAVKKVFGKDGLTPMWVADMDFETPEFIVDAMKQRLDHPVFGYTAEPEDFRPAIMDWIREHHGWKVESGWISYIPGIVKGIGMAINALLEKGGLSDFEALARRLSMVWFSGDEGDGDTSLLEEYVLSGAVYGSKHNAAAGNGGRVKYLVTRIFMPYSQLKYKYPSLNGRPYLYGFYVVKRWMNLLKGKRARRSMDELKATCTVSTPESTKYSQLFKKIKL